ncbi:MAG: ferritin family protein [Peptoniphilaceae bacterium]|nr:Rubrerythrin-2 [Peptoniphilaceae bacterium]MDD7434173.1 ferritin family protein [Peptoniphilaceae bacterium]MDY3075269.1 ferritin family protein [Peptoniphilaceae bacterium]MDY5841984.1 ferritin family protein [Peptoniphilaceae bacterium]
MKKMTQANLRSAFGGESQARNRYNIWAEVAGKEGFPNVKRLFNATADAERIHAALHFNALKDVHGDFDVTSAAGFGVGTTSENLEGAIGGETFEFTEMYPAYIAVAEMQEEAGAVRAMRFAIEAEKVHAKMFGIAKDAVDQGKDLEVKDQVYLCPICGYVALSNEGKCPICGTDGSKFVAY